jgi:hypothetical protein
MAITVAEADAYFATRLHSDAWDQADHTTKAKALATAERHINALRLREDADQQARTEAICEQALWLLSATAYQRTREAEMARGIIGGGVGDANEYSSDMIVRKKMAGVQICPEALSRLSEWIVRYRMGDLR